MFKHHIFQFNKLNYINKLKRPQVDCILCAATEKNPEVTSLEVVRSERFVVSINLYPYNSGHLMIYPIRHITDYREMNTDEQVELVKLTSFFITILEKLYHPTGFNVGFNLGESSGASISHIHQHIIPRFKNELGIVDLIGGAKVIVENPVESKDKMRMAVMENKSLIDVELK